MYYLKVIESENDSEIRIYDLLLKITLQVQSGLVSVVKNFTCRHKHILTEVHSDPVIQQVKYLTFIQ